MVERLCTEQGEIYLFLLPGGLLVCELCRARLLVYVSLLMANLARGSLLL